MATNTKIEILEIRVKRSPAIILLCTLLSWLIIIILYANGYFDSLAAVILMTVAALINLFLVLLLPDYYRKQLHNERQAAEIEAGERLTNGEPMPTFNGVPHYGIKSDDGGYQKFEVLTDDKKKELISTGLLRVPARQ